MGNYYIVKISGKYLKSFIKSLFRLGIDILDIKYLRNGILIKIKYNDYDRVKSIKTTNEIEIVKVSGYRKFKDIINKYFVFFIFSLFSLFLVYVLSHITFFVNFSGVNNDFKNVLLESLNSYGISSYSFDKSFDEYKDIALSIKNKYNNEIEWIEIVNDGISINVDVIPRKNNLESSSDVKTNIVAKKNGIIKNIISTKGQIMVDGDDYVKKGDVIVSGVIYRNGRAVDIVNANGSVFAEVWYKVKLNSSYYMKERSVSYVKRSFYVDILGKRIKLFSYYVNLEKVKDKYLYKGAYFSLGLDDEVYYEDVSVKFSEDELKDILFSKAKKAVLDNLSFNEKILEEKTLKIYNNNGRMYVEVFIKTYENIAESVVIEKTNLEDYSE